MIGRFDELGLQRMIGEGISDKATPARREICESGIRAARRQKAPACRNRSTPGRPGPIVRADRAYAGRLRRIWRGCHPHVPDVCGQRRLRAGRRLRASIRGGRPRPDGGLRGNGGAPRSPFRVRAGSLPAVSGRPDLASSFGLANGRRRAPRRTIPHNRSGFGRGGPRQLEQSAGRIEVTVEPRRMTAVAAIPVDARTRPARN